MRGLVPGVFWAEHPPLRTEAQVVGVACPRSLRQIHGDLGTAPLSFPHPNLWNLLETQAHPFPPRHIAVPRLIEKRLPSLLDLSSDTLGERLWVGGCSTAGLSSDGTSVSPWRN